MTSREYRAAVDGSQEERQAFRGRVPPTPWDPPLQAALDEHGVAVYEEDMRAQLLEAMHAGGV